VKKAIFSALAQEYVDVECIIVDDSSTDSTSEIVESIASQDDRVKYHRLPNNSGSPAEPRNVGIKLSRFQYVALLDSDDEWLSDKLSKQLAFMDKTGAAISCTGYRVVNESNERIGSFRPVCKTSYETLLRHNTVGCSTVVIDTQKIENFKFPVCGHEDYALWLELARRGYDIFGLDEELGVYKVAAGSVSANKVKVLKFFWNIYKNREGFSKTKSFLYCLRYAWNVRKKYQ
jgi:teichuronic acid biosynthesis glycosyltransferase TuaG